MSTSKHIKKYTVVILIVLGVLICFEICFQGFLRYLFFGKGIIVS